MEQGDIPKNPEITFKQFLEKNTNLLTIFGIFNALALWASGLESEEHRNWLSVTFMLLSIMALWEVLLEAGKQGDEKIKFLLFNFLLTLAQLGIGYYTLVTFKDFFAAMAIIIFVLLICVVYSIIFMLIVLIFLALSKIKVSEKKRKGFVPVYLLLSLFPTKITVSYIFDLIDKHSIILDFMQ